MCQCHCNDHTEHIHIGNGAQTIRLPLYDDAITVTADVSYVGTIYDRKCIYNKLYIEYDGKTIEYLCDQRLIKLQSFSDIKTFKISQHRLRGADDKLCCANCRCFVVQCGGIHTVAIETHCSPFYQTVVIS